MNHVIEYLVSCRASKETALNCIKTELSCGIQAGLENYCQAALQISIIYGLVKEIVEMHGIEWFLLHLSPSEYWINLPGIDNIYELIAVYATKDCCSVLADALGPAFLEFIFYGRIKSSSDDFHKWFCEYLDTVHPNLPQIVIKAETRLQDEIVTRYPITKLN